MEIIDFHTHTFEEYIVDKALDKLSHSANVISYIEGTDAALHKSNEEDNIALSVSLPVATKIMQSDKINAKNVKKNGRTDDTGLLYFAAIHPEDSNISARLSNIKAAGFKGIKIHPVFQDAYINESCYLKLIDVASEIGLITVIHAGEDISFPGCDWAGVKYLIEMIDIVRPRNLVLAHMGGWKEWDAVESDLAGADVYFDTSFCLEELLPLDSTKPASDVKLSTEQFKRIVAKHGSDKILFGTDSPWSDRKKAIDNIKAIGFDDESLNKIFYENAKGLLKL